MDIRACASSSAEYSGSLESEVASKGAEQGLSGLRDSWYWNLAGGRELTPELPLPGEDISPGSPWWASRGQEALRTTEDVLWDDGICGSELLLESRLD